MSSSSSICHQCLANYVNEHHPSVVTKNASSRSRSSEHEQPHSSTSVKHSTHSHRPSTTVIRNCTNSQHDSIVVPCSLCSLHKSAKGHSSAAKPKLHFPTPEQMVNMYLTPLPEYPSIKAQQQHYQATLYPAKRKRPESSHDLSEEIEEMEIRPVLQCNTNEADQRRRANVMRPRLTEEAYHHRGQNTLKYYHYDTNIGFCGHRPTCKGKRHLPPKSFLEYLPEPMDYAITPDYATYPTY